ncbi:MAG: ChbG/HpnK family deacetylase [Acidimicrobiales bacterium]
MRTSDQLFVNLDLLEKGFAGLLIYAPNDHYESLFTHAGAASRPAWGVGCVRRSRRSPRIDGYRRSVESLAEGLGHPPDARLLILSADQLGSTHAATAGGYAALPRAATTATVMMPGPWSRYAADHHGGADIGIHLTLNAQLDGYRWGPLTTAPSLLDGDGGFPRTADDLWDHADLDEVRRECRAQLERARLWGFDLTHVATHLGTLQQRRSSSMSWSTSPTTPSSPCGSSGAAEDRAGFPSGVSRQRRAS